MAKLAKTFSLSEKSIELINEHMTINNLSTQSAALENILREYQILKENNLNVNVELKRLRFDTSDTLKKIMVMYEMLNNFLINQNVDKYISSDMLKNISTEKAEKHVEDYMHQRSLSKKK